MPKSKSQPQVIVNNRSAVSGKFVSEQYAKSHPRTTVTERNKVPSKAEKRG